MELTNASNSWSEFGFTENQCGQTEARTSPVDVCARPRRHCLEHHEFRSRRGDFRMGSAELDPQILPDKLRVLAARRAGDEPDPPHVDFGGVGFGHLDLLHVDLKFPAEHTVCGRRYDGEMRYYFFHPVKRSLVVLAWLLEAPEEEATAHAEASGTENRQMQYLIDAFQELYDTNQAACRRNGTEEVRRLSEGTSVALPLGTATAASHRGDAAKRTASGRERRKLDKDRRGPRVWDPFHPDIQKTIHFWGYTGALTEPPCAGDVLWRIMDVPVPLASAQLRQLRRVLFDNVDPRTCARTSTHYRGSAARPIAAAAAAGVRYYKCTRSDYVSDDERSWCGDGGCADCPFGKGFYPYVAPIVHVTGPPSESPTMSMLPTQSL